MILQYLACDGHDKEAAKYEVLTGNRQSVKIDDIWCFVTDSDVYNRLIRARPSLSMKYLELQLWLSLMVKRVKCFAIMLKSNWAGTHQSALCAALS